MSAAGPDALLRLEAVGKRFGGVRALSDISMSVGKNRIVGVIGPNGAGKTTLFNLITGAYRSDSGAIVFDGRQITDWPPHRIIRAGLARTFQNIRLFQGMTALENLELGAHQRRGAGVAEDFTRVYELFPLLKEREGQKAGTMSGGEQQMLAIGRALMARPKLLMLDEPSLGIAPLVVQRIYQTIAEINSSGVAILLVEQNANYALDAASRGYVLETGHVALANDSASLRNDPEVQRAYLGT